MECRKTNRAVIKAIILALATISYVACEENESTDLFELRESVDRVVVNVDLGDLTVLGRPGQGATVEVSVECRTAVPDYDVRREGSTLYIELEAGAGASACEGNFYIAIQSDASVELNTGRGEIAVARIDGDVQAVTYQGGVTIADIQGETDIRTINGDVLGTGLGERAGFVEIGAGDADLHYVSAPSLVEVETINGDATVSVPKGNYRVEADTGSGQVRLEGLAHQKSAGNALVLTVDSGDIFISGN